MRSMLVAMAVLGGCHADECTWLVDRPVAETTVSLTRGGVPLEASVEYAGISSFRTKQIPSRATMAATIAVANDAQIDSVVVYIKIGHELEASESLTELDSRFQLVRGKTIVGEGAPTGSLAFDTRDVRCEENDPGGNWSCGTNADAMLDAAYEDYALSIAVTQREMLREACRSCDGIEGCNY